MLLFAQTATRDRSYDEEEMLTYTESPDFAYMDLSVRPPSIWERLQWWFASLISKLFMNPNTPWLSNLLFYTLLIVVLGAAIFYIVRLRYGGGVMGERKHVGYGDSSLHIEGGGIDYDRVIKEALQSDNYKLAIRYVYLKTLTILAQRELIRLKDWKSPLDYNRELSEELVPVYYELSQLFEYVWYGDFDATHGDYEKGSQLSSQLQERTK